jgi:hypothetical protein
MKNEAFREGIWENDKRIRWLDESNENDYTETSQIKTEYSKTGGKSNMKGL